MPNTDAERIAALLLEELHGGNEVYRAECERAAAVLTAAGGGFVAEAEREREEAESQEGFAVATAEDFERALDDLRAQAGALAEKWEYGQITGTMPNVRRQERRKCAQQVRALISGKGMIAENRDGADEQATAVALNIGTYFLGAWAEAAAGVRGEGWENDAAREAAQQWLARGGNHG